MPCTPPSLRRVAVYQSGKSRRSRPKISKEWLCRSSIVMTFDVYGHLFKKIDKLELAASTTSVLN